MEIIAASDTGLIYTFQVGKMCKADVIYARDLEQCWGQDGGTYRKVKNHIMVLVVCTVTILSSITGTFTSISSITKNLTILSVSNHSLQCRTNIYHVP